ncbi:hypothetical protein H5410_033182 [Solanum commersonii]|uniref:Uncharacterized protein n=1 Tax=Solanum commersonii TaxID=4109 RepID=A0A9J5YRU1_SOLCO|nr:hypothetical protein H5410_033182 [Solanum commersonii]
MKKLRHVNIDCFSVVWEDINDEGSFEECSPTMLENMKIFHTCHILLDNRNPRFWWRFPNLEELSFYINGLPSCSLFPLLQVHTRLHSLFVQLPDYIFWDTYGWERYFVFPSNLRHLCLAGCFLTEEMVLNIARLKKLETLRLEMGFHWTRRGGYCWDITNVEFPALKYLTLFSMQIDEWKASDDSFPVLEELSIESAHYFKEIPPSFADIPTLRLIQLTNCIDSLGVSAMNIKETLKKSQELTVYKLHQIEPIDMDVVETSGKGALLIPGTSVQRSFSSIDEEIVGFEKDAESIMQKLTRGTKKLDVISIFGMPGIGKTTLARKVYNIPSIVNHFDVKVWCSVSQEYDRRPLLGEILKQTTRKSEIIEADDKPDMLRRSLIGRRYLIVLDDIWDVKAWEDLGLCFPMGENGSRVIVTTRIEQVAKLLQHHSDPYPLRFLTRAESWELLQKKVFRGESCPPSLLPAAIQVAQHCKGLPLVIVLVAGRIIGEKKWESSSLWLDVANDLSSYVLGEQSLKVIQSSYDHLEDHLKACLLYMALFPEDHEILVSNLLKLWMAEEFVLNVDTENMEEASRICLNDLLNRSLVMVSKRSANGDTKYCILHDVVHEFCLRKLTEDKYMQLAVPYNPYQHLHSMESRLWIYIHDDLVEQLDHSEYQLDKIPMLESTNKTYCFGKCPMSSLEFIAHPKFNTWNLSNPLPLLVKLRLVRVLHFPLAKLPSSWPSAVQSLTHLRYLEIYVQEFNFKWISHLLDLQTLVVRSSNSLRTSLAAIWKMTKLRHVDIYNLSLI